MINVNNVPGRETQVGREMARLNACIEEAEKSQAEQQERIGSVLSQESGTLKEKVPTPPTPAMVPLASTLADFADRVSRLAKRTQEVTARIEL
jgi:hypothetical protein